MCTGVHKRLCSLLTLLVCVFVTCSVAFASESGSVQDGSATVVSKPYVSAMSKDVSVDGETWSDEVDASVGCLLRYRLTGTMPERLADFKQYPYAFEDTMDSAIVVDASSVRVSRKSSAGTEDVTAAFSVKLSDNKLVVSCDDIISAIHGISPTDVLVVTYDATLSEPDIGLSNPNENRAHVRYVDKENKPETTPDDVTFAYSYELRIVKQGTDGSKGLSGARFAVESADGGWYDGSGFSGTESSRELLVTDEDGDVSLRGLGTGTYRIHEVEPPNGYLPLGEVIDLTVTRDRGADGSPSLSAKAEHAEVSSVNAETGRVDVIVRDDAEGSGLLVPTVGTGGFVNGGNGSSGVAGNRSSSPLSVTGDSVSYGLVMVFFGLGLAGILCGVTVARRESR